MNAPAADVKLCVIVVNYRSPEMLIDCLTTVLPQARALGAKVVVVDNASPDDSVPTLRQWIADHAANDCVELIASSTNDGFAAGNNIGIQSCRAELYLLLNSDTLLREGALARLVAAIASDDDIGLVSPRLEWPSGEPQESCFRYHRPASQLIESARTGLITRALKRYQVPLQVDQRHTFPEWTSFACVMIRRDVFERVGLLDDGFFMYFEDVEFSHRARHAGYRIMNEPAARVVHLRGGSSPLKSKARLRKRLPRYFYEARTRYFYKLYGRGGLLAANCLWTLGWSVSLLRGSIEKDYESPACERQWQDLWINFRHPLGPYTHPDRER